MRTRIVTFLVLVTALSVFIPTRGYSSENEINRESIRGMKGVHVVIEKLGQGEYRDGLAADLILKDVELQLRKNGITVLTEAGMRIYPGNPLLYININTIKINKVKAYIYSLSIELEQSVILERNKMPMRAVTWNSGVVKHTSANKLNNIRKDIKELVDRFINACLSVNTKE
jgi:hypothetical protein